MPVLQYSHLSHDSELSIQNVTEKIMSNEHNNSSSLEHQEISPLYPCDQDKLHAEAIICDSMIKGTSTDTHDNSIPNSEDKNFNEHTNPRKTNFVFVPALPQMEGQNTKNGHLNKNDNCLQSENNINNICLTERAKNIKESPEKTAELQNCDIDGDDPSGIKTILQDELLCIELVDNLIKQAIDNREETSCDIQNTVDNLPINNSTQNDVDPEYNNYLKTTALESNSEKDQNHSQGILSESESPAGHSKSLEDFKNSKDDDSIQNEGMPSVNFNSRGMKIDGSKEIGKTDKENSAHLDHFQIEVSMTEDDCEEISTLKPISHDNKVEFLFMRGLPSQMAKNCQEMSKLAYISLHINFEVVPTTIANIISAATAIQ